MANEARFVISVAAELAGMHPQTLRQYDRLGLVTPERAKGRGRRYSSQDVARLREIQRLSQEEGINLAGIRRIMDLHDQVQRLQLQLAQLGRQVSQPASAPSRVFTADAGGSVSFGEGAMVDVSLHYRQIPTALLKLLAERHGK